MFTTIRKTIHVITVAIFSTLFSASGAATQSDVSDHKYNHFAKSVNHVKAINSPRSTKQLKKQTPLVRERFNASTASETDSLCTLDNLYLLTGNELVNQIVACEHGAFGSELFEESEYTQQLFSEANMFVLANAIQTRAVKYSSENRQSLAELMLVARAGFYVEFYSESFNYPSSINSAFNLATKAFSNNHQFLSIDDEHGKVLSEWINLVDGSDNWINSYDALFAIYDRYPTQSLEETSYYGIKPLYDVQFAIWRGQNNSEEFAELINNDENMVPRYLRFIADMEIYVKTSNEGAFTNTLVELGRLLKYNGQQEQASSAISVLLSSYTRMSAAWLYLVNSVNQFGDCSQFDNICQEDINDELMARAFPNTFIFDDGNLVIRTAIDDSKAQVLYHAQKQVEAQFKRKNQELEALESDENQVLTMFVYGTRYDYELFQPILFDLDTDNGGIYIESWGQFFTYDRTSAESIYSLEELFRHEYVHYLQARYTAEGLWGETEMYQNNRLTWYEEGGAEFFAGATQNEGVALRKVMLQQINGDQGSHMSIDEITNASYATGFKFYRYAALFFNFLNDTQPQIITELHKTIRSDDVVAFDTLVDELSNNVELQNHFSEYLTEKLSTFEEMSDFSSTSFPRPPYLDTDLLEDIQTAILGEGVFSSAVCSSTATTLNARFTCSGSIIGKDYADINNKIDAGITALNQDLNNFITMNCSLGEPRVHSNETSAPYSCEGGLRELGTTQVLNQPPIANAGEDKTVALRVPVTISGINSTDPEGNPLTYSWKQIAGEPVENIDPAGGFNKVSLAFYAYEEHLNSELIFELSVSDDEYTSTDTVVIAVGNVSESQDLTANAGEDRSVGIRVPVKLSGINSTVPSNSVLTYRWRQLAGLPVENVAPEGGFDKVSLSFYAYEEHLNSQLIFELTVSDGENVSSDTVVITVSNSPNSQTLAANAGEDRSVGIREVVRLSGADSTAPNGSVLTYRWKQITGEPVRNVSSVGGFDKESLSFYPYENHFNSQLTFELTVSDGEQTSTDIVVITVGNFSNSSTPVAKAGGDRTVNLLDIVRLNAINSTAPIGSVLTYNWKQITGKPVENVSSVGGFDKVELSFYAYEEHLGTELIFELTVSDGQSQSTDTVVVTVNSLDNIQTSVAKVGMD